MNSQIDPGPAFLENSEKIEKAFSVFSDETASIKPSPAEWSALECLEHLIVIEKTLFGVFRGPKQVREGDPMQKAAEIRSKFLDFERKFKAFGPIIPKGELNNLKSELEKMKENRRRLITVGQEEGWENECLAFSHPLFGTLTLAEWISFCIIHADRHLGQVKNIFTQVSS